MNQSLNLRKTLRRILAEQTEDLYEITPEKYEELMKLSSYRGDAITRMKQFGGKPLHITGNLDLSDTPTRTLGNVKKISGKLDIRNTQVSDISGIEISGYVWDSNTPIQKRREAAILQGKRNEAEQRRQDDEWSVEGGNTLGLKALALYRYLVNNREIDEMDEGDKEELISKKTELQTLKQQYDELEDDDSELYDRISDLETEIEEIESKNADVYNIIPMKYSNYGLTMFEVIDVDDLKGHEYSVGDEDETDEAAEEYARNYIDEVGIEGFRDGFIEDCLDESAIEDYFREYYYDDIRENPEGYFDEEYFQPTEAEQERIDHLEEYIKKLEVNKSKLESEEESYGDKFEEYLTEIESKIEEAQDEIDQLSEEKEVTTTMVEEMAEDMVQDKMRNPLNSLKDWGINVQDYIDKDKFTENLVRSDGYGIISSYDGSYDTEEIDGVIYYIFRNN